MGSNKIGFVYSSPGGIDRERNLVKLSFRICPK